MKTTKIFSFTILFCVLFAFPCLAESGDVVDVVFMHDVHSFLDKTAQVKTLIDTQKAKNESTLILDAGDFSMGTLYQTVYSSQAAELRVLGAIGADVTTFGNHEYDFGAKGLSAMLEAAIKSGEKLPSIVVTNADFAATNNYTNELRSSLEDYGVKDYVILEKGNSKIAVLGVFGQDALLCAPTCEIVFTDQYEAIKKTVEYIKKNEEVDMIVCISHSGTNKKESKSEDEILAKKVPDIDLIVSGHTHTVLSEPIKHGNTYIVSCGAYSKYLGFTSMEQKADGRWNMTSYNLLEITDSIPANPEIDAKLETFQHMIDQESLANFGYSSNQILTSTPVSLSKDTEVGYLMADSYVDTVSKLGIPVEVAVVPSGVIRGTYKEGDVTVSDVFTSFSLGIGPDEITGYPLVAVWLTSNDLKNAMEIDASLSPLMDTVRLFTSGLSYTYNPRRFILDKVTSVRVEDSSGKLESIDPNKLYCVVTDFYTGMMLGGILNTTKGLISIVPRFEDGTPVTNFSDVIIYDINGNEQKGWVTIAESLDNIDSIPNYSKAESEAKIAEPSLNPVKLFSNPSKLATIIYIVIASLVVIIILIIFLVSRRKKRV